MSGVTAELARFSAEIGLDRLPPEVARRARFLVLDLVGNIVRARHDAESTPATPRPVPRCSTARSATRSISTTPTRPARCIQARR
jgi:hypothetical protein